MARIMKVEELAEILMQSENLEASKIMIEQHVKEQASRICQHNEIGWRPEKSSYCCHKCEKQIEVY